MDIFSLSFIIYNNLKRKYYCIVKICKIEKLNFSHADHTQWKSSIASKTLICSAEQPTRSIINITEHLIVAHLQVHLRLAFTFPLMFSASHHYGG